MIFLLFEVLGLAKGYVPTFWLPQGSRYFVIKELGLKDHNHDGF